ncbi:MAG: hypothetical protein ABWX62_04090 [Microterricola sp.]
MNPPARRPDRTLLVILIAIAALVIIALVVVFTRSAPAALDPGTPEGVVQGYSAAVIDGDNEAALEYLAPEVREQCDGLDGLYTENLRVVLLDSDDRGESAQVQVSLVTSYDGGLFGSSSSESTETFSLVKNDGEWAITTVPWSLAICAGSAGY